jgi:glycosyltransferase involved in cell wall biosynthesis
VIGNGGEMDRLKKNAGKNIEFLGWVDDEKLQEYYSNCSALIFPGDEDFGIVPLEAQLRGKPVIAFGKGGVLETADRKFIE